MGICRCLENKPCSVHFFRRHANPERYEAEKKKFVKKTRKKKEDKLVTKLEPCVCDNCECQDHSDCYCDDCECVVCEC